MAFDQTLRTLSAMKLRTHAALLLLASLAFVAWACWLVFGRVSVYVKSEKGRLEVDPAPMPVNAPVDGVVTECYLTLGQRLAKGTPLFQLDARTFELQVAEVEATLRADEAALNAERSELSAEEAAKEAMEHVVATTQRAGAVRVEASRAASAMKERENDVVARLSNAELASKLDSIRMLSETNAQQLQVRVSSEQAALDTSNAKMTLEDRSIRVSTLKTQVITAENAIQLARARLATLNYEVDRRHVRAQADGVLSDVVACSSGMTVTSALRLATLQPDGLVHVVAYFDPSDAVGRVQKGQPAVVRVDNFPWTQYGTLQAVVRAVGSEPRDGTIRVELGVTGNNPAIPAIHGLIASVEVQSERISPARLLLRLAGQMLSSARRPSAAQPLPATTGREAATR